MPSTTGPCLAINARVSNRCFSRTPNLVTTKANMGGGPKSKKPWFSSPTQFPPGELEVIPLFNNTGSGPGARNYFGRERVGTPRYSRPSDCLRVVEAGQKALVSRATRQFGQGSPTGWDPAATVEAVSDLQVLRGNPNVTSDSSVFKTTSRSLAQKMLSTGSTMAGTIGTWNQTSTTLSGSLGILPEGLPSDSPDLGSMQALALSLAPKDLRSTVKALEKIEMKSTLPRVVRTLDPNVWTLGKEGLLRDVRGVFGGIEEGPFRSGYPKGHPGVKAETLQDYQEKEKKWFARHASLYDNTGAPQHARYSTANI